MHPGKQGNEGEVHGSPAAPLSIPKYSTALLPSHMKSKDPLRTFDSYGFSQNELQAIHLWFILCVMQAFYNISKLIPLFKNKFLYILQALHCLLFQKETNVSLVKKLIRNP